MYTICFFPFVGRVGGEQVLLWVIIGFCELTCIHLRLNWGDCSPFDSTGNYCCFVQDALHPLDFRTSIQNNSMRGKGRFLPVRSSLSGAVHLSNYCLRRTATCPVPVLHYYRQCRLLSGWRNTTAKIMFSTGSLQIGAAVKICYSS